MNDIDESPTINIEIIDDLVSILGDEFFDILLDFINSTPAQLSLLDSAIQQTDFNQIFSLAHAQSGATGNIGLTRFHDLSKLLCQHAKAENIDQCSMLVIALHKNYAECKELLIQKINTR